MRLSEERIAHLAARITDALLDEEHVDLEMSEGRLRALVEDRITTLLAMEDEIDEAASTWMHQHKPHLEDGTAEFEIELEKVKKTLADQRGYVLY